MDWLDFKEFIKDSFYYILTFAIVLLIVIYIFSFTLVVGPSMEDTLKNGDVTVISKLHYRFLDIERFDVISIMSKDYKYLIKRVIGLPGDTIKYVGGTLYVNGELFEEDYLNDIKTAKFKLNDFEVVVPEERYFVLGDNRDNSKDSRDEAVGFITKDDIIGRIFIRIFPFNKIGIFK
jgi:signal peptidase I